MRFERSESFRWTGCRGPEQRVVVRKQGKQNSKEEGCCWSKSVSKNVLSPLDACRKLQRTTEDEESSKGRVALRPKSHWRLDCMSLETSWRLSP